MGPGADLDVQPDILLIASAHTTERLLLFGSDAIHSLTHAHAHKPSRNVTSASIYNRMKQVSVICC